VSRSRPAASDRIASRCRRSMACTIH